MGGVEGLAKQASDLRNAEVPDGSICCALGVDPTTLWLLDWLWQSQASDWGNHPWDMFKMTEESDGKQGTRRLDRTNAGLGLRLSRNVRRAARRSGMGATRILHTAGQRRTGTALASRPN